MYEEWAASTCVCVWGIDRKRDYCRACSGAVSGRMTAVNGERERIHKKEKQNSMDRGEDGDGTMMGMKCGGEKD